MQAQLWALICKNMPFALSQHLKPVWCKRLQSPRTVELPLKPKSGANTPSIDHKPPSASAPQVWALFQLWAGTAQKSWICCSSETSDFWEVSDCCSGGGGGGGCSILWMCTIYCMLSRSSCLQKKDLNVLQIYICYIYLHQPHLSAAPI